jgi:Rod binding domain-containing protein
MNIVAPGSQLGTGSALSNTASDTARLTAAAKEFESVLLGQWLKEADSTFGSVPGSEEDDAGGQQMKEFAMQQVATDFTERGGIGIAPMVERALAKQETPQVTQGEGKGH